jgi:hypothetical protein
MVNKKKYKCRGLVLMFKKGNHTPWTSRSPSWCQRTAHGLAQGGKKRPHMSGKLRAQPQSGLHSVQITCWTLVTQSKRRETLEHEVQMLKTPTQWLQPLCHIAIVLWAGEQSAPLYSPGNFKEKGLGEVHFRHKNCRGSVFDTLPPSVTKPITTVLSQCKPGKNWPADYTHSPQAPTKHPRMC